MEEDTIINDDRRDKQEDVIIAADRRHSTWHVDDWRAERATGNALQASRERGGHKNQHNNVASRSYCCCSHYRHI
eukprot:scaffold16445_cov62-Skeletonema_dohrnii-CCMP3373.AAC.1